MKTRINFLQSEQGQDLVEYALLLAFAAWASAALIIGAGNAVLGVWTVSNSRLVVANTTAGSSPSGSSPANF
jgi:Flp pilus assembly pilin Flp